jgi:Nitroreductase family
MIKGSKVRKARHPIEPLLLARWSPRTMSGEEISQEELMRLFEAVRWAPSSFNRAAMARPLRARRGTEHWQTFFDLLAATNKPAPSPICLPTGMSFMRRPPSDD